LLNKLNTEAIVAVGLVIALLAAIFYEQKDLAMNIATGLVGWMGRGLVKGENQK